MQIEVNGYILEVPDDYNDDQIDNAITEFTSEMSTEPVVDTGTVTRGGEHAAKPDELYYGATDEDVTGLPSLPTAAQEAAPQTDVTGLPEIDTSYKPITLGERVGAWWNDTELRDPGVNPYEGMTPAQILEAEGGDAETVGSLNQLATDEFAIDEERKIGADSVIRQRALELVERNPDMTFAEANEKAKRDYKGERAEAGVLAASMAMPLGGSLIRAAGIGALGSAAAGATGNVVAGRDVTEDLGGDVLLGGGAGAAGRLVGKGIGYVADRATRKATGMAPKSLEELNAMGAEAGPRYDAFRKSQEIHRADLQARMARGELTPAQAQAEFASRNDETWAALMQRNFDESKVAPADIIAASAKADELTQTPGLRSGTGTIREQVDNPALRQMLDDAGVLGIERLPTGAARHVVNKPTQELIGLRSPGLYRDRSTAVVKESQRLFSEADDLIKMNPGEKVLAGMAKDLKQAASKLGKGETKEANVHLKDVNKAFQQRGVELSQESAEAINNLKAQLQTLRKVKTGGVETNALINMAKTFAPSIALGGYGGYGEGGSWEKALSGAAIGALGRGAVSKISSKMVASRLAEVKKALGGKYKVDAETSALLEAGMDVGTVIAHVVMRNLFNEGKSME